jgi:diguanylate cyclase (GGDEF)-like protein
MKPALRTSLQILAFVVLAALSIYLLPNQQYSVSYDYTVGRPWGYGLLKADVDFPILKTDAELEAERARLLKGFVPVYKRQVTPDSTALFVLSVDEMERVVNNGWKQIRVTEDNVSNLVLLQDLYTPKTAYQLTGKTCDVNMVYDTIKSEGIMNECLDGMSLVHGMVFRGTKIVDSGEKGSVGIVNMDLNGLKRINDTRGHESGDRYLQHAAGVMKDIFGEADVYRSGGDEFIAIVEDKTHEAFSQLLDNLHRMEVEDPEFNLAIGYYWSEDGISDVRTAFKAADNSMYSDKRRYYSEHPELDRRRVH